MLEEMRIRGLGVIADAVLELAPGLTVVTGETGAGKTMVVTALGLLLGGRADAGAVRSGMSQAVVEGRVQVDPASLVARLADDAGAELDDGALILARTVTAAGRSRAHAGGRSVPVGLLSELGTELVTVHGQSDQLRLLQPARQRETLDRFAAHDDLLAEHAAAYGELQELDARIVEVTGHTRERAQEAARLREALERVAALDPRRGEDHELREEDERLAHADGLRAAAQDAHVVLAGDLAEGTSGQGGQAGDAMSLVAAARRAVEPVREHDPALGDVADRLGEIAYLLADLATDVASYATGIESDPGRLGVVQQRRAELTALVRAVGQPGPEGAEPDVASVLDWAADASTRLLELEDDEGLLDRLGQQRTALRTRLADLSGRLHRSRLGAAERLGALVDGELAQLAMPHASLAVSLTARDDPAGLAVELATGQRTVSVAAHGVDDIELLLAPHAGAPARPLSKGASGGELSRIMLALEVVLAGADPVPTFVFDEVDAGVGGHAAVEIGRRLAQLARTAQVLVVTHLPQVAAFADQHLTVVKADDGAVTESGVRRLDGESRITELARMLAGHEDSGAARAHAQELRDAAAADVAAMAR